MMKVESFSQLPFVRPVSKDKSSVRLFGIEFDTDETTTNHDSSSSSTAVKESNNSRRFECNYCCRNFPTSQALGGHQNAHKRERQQAKRAQLQSSSSTLMAHNSLPADTYFLNYRHGIPSHSPKPYPSMGNASGGNYYTSSYSQQQQPVNGSPLGLWQSNSMFNPDRNSLIVSNNPYPILPLFCSTNEHHKPSCHDHLTGIGGSSSQSRSAYESKASMKDHVSLDLHL